MVKTFPALLLITTTGLLFAMGCQQQTEQTTSEPRTTVTQTEADGLEHQGSADADIEAAMAELSPEDRKEAESQKFCAVMTTSRLGSMGAPLKLDVQGQPVFVCCAGCKTKATKNADETLATVAKLKAENASSKE